MIPRPVLSPCDANVQSLAHVLTRESNDAHMAKVLTEDKERRTAANIARLPTSARFKAPWHAQA